jgi:hypothetical protein
MTNTPRTEMFASLALTLAPGVGCQAAANKIAVKYPHLSRLVSQPTARRTRTDQQIDTGFARLMPAILPLLC